MFLQKLLSNIAFLDWSYEKMANSCLRANAAHYVVEADEGKQFLHFFQRVFLMLRLNRCSTWV